MTATLEDVAALLGHRCEVVSVHSRTYEVRCSCGYVNAGRVRVSRGGRGMTGEARRYRLDHLERVVREARREGRLAIADDGSVGVSS